MNRRLLKERAKDVLRTNYWNVLKAIMIVTLLSLAFVSIESETSFDPNLYDYVTRYYFSIFALKWQLQPTLLVMAIVAIASIAGLIYSYLVGAPLTYGLNNYIKYVAMGRGSEFDIFEGFRHRYSAIVKLHIMRDLKVLLWTLCLIVPGIIKAMEYQFADQILEEHPEWDYRQVLEESARLTYGHKWEIFVLSLSFFFWMILFGLVGMLTFGIGSYLLEPYTRTTTAYAYLWLKEIDQPAISYNLVANDDRFFAE